MMYSVYGVTKPSGYRGHITKPWQLFAVAFTHWICMGIMPIPPYLCALHVKAKSWKRLEAQVVWISSGIATKLVI